MLRRYGVIDRPRAAARTLLCEMAICAGQLLLDRTAKGIEGRVRGWRDAAGLTLRGLPASSMIDLSLRAALWGRLGQRSNPT
jgi:hypothetical protein